MYKYLCNLPMQLQINTTRTVSHQKSTLIFTLNAARVCVSIPHFWKPAQTTANIERKHTSPRKITTLFTCNNRSKRSWQGQKTLTEDDRWKKWPMAQSNSNSNSNPIQRRYSRLFTISSQHLELSPTHMLKWPRHNRVQIMCNTSSAFHVQVSCYVPLGTKR